MHKTEPTKDIKELIKINEKNNNNIIIGNFDIDVLSQEIIDQEFLQALLERGDCPGCNSISRPSTIYNNKGTCIYNFYIKLGKTNYKTYLLRTSLNDHYPLIMTLNNIQKNIGQSVNKKIDLQELKVTADAVDWNEIVEETDPNIATNMLIDQMKH